MNILLATDGSEHSAAAVDEVVRRHPPAGTRVRVISVFEPPYFPQTYPLGGMDMSLYEEMQKGGREEARSAVEKAASELRERGRKLNVTTEVLAGSPKRVILEDAETFGADLIVVGSHGRGTLERFLLGSVSQAVALHAKCSVEIVRAPRPQA
jgi:nucleotide-binding universal stress UspA family protein